MSEKQLDGSSYTAFICIHMKLCARLFLFGLLTFGILELIPESTSLAGSSSQTEMAKSKSKRKNKDRDRNRSITISAKSTKTTGFRTAKAAEANKQAATSSQNRYLTPQQRAMAAQLEAMRRSGVGLNKSKSKSRLRK